MNDCDQNIDSLIQGIWGKFQSGDVQGALSDSESAIEPNPDNAALYVLASRMLRTSNATGLAIDLMEKATKQADTTASHLLELAELYVATGHVEKAEAAYKAHLKMLPNSPQGYLALAKLYETQGNLEGAEEVLRTAVEAAAGEAESQTVRLNDLASWLRQNGRTQDAIDALQRALQLVPGQPHLNYNIANNLMDMGRPDDAIKHYRLSLDINADHPDGHLHLGFAYLLKGNFKRGWREMEWRWKLPAFQAGLPDTPRWKGEQIDGTVLLLAEQGLGDSVHFIRYAALVAERCSRVVVYCPATLQRLLQTAPGVDEVVNFDAPIPAHDAYIPIMSLPAVFKTDMNTIPATVPYLSADAGEIATCAAAVKDLPGPKIGIVWQGNPQNPREAMRTIPTDAVLELVRGMDASFVCMHKDRPEDITDWPDNLHHFSDLMGDLADAAALTENFDLVLSIDTLMTHLAGALDKDLWVLLAPAADWRYLLDREDSPWYPSARLIRRTADEDWSAFTARVLQDLKARF